LRRNALEVDPRAAAPVAATFMLADRDLRARSPRVPVDDHAGLPRIDMTFLHVPADIAAAGNVGRCRRCGQRQRRSTQRCGEKGLGRTGHFQAPRNDPPDSKKATGARTVPRKLRRSDASTEWKEASGLTGLLGALRGADAAVLRFLRGAGEPPVVPAAPL